MKEEVKEKAQERTTLKKGELLMLRVAAATGVLSMISHGLELISKLFG